MYKIKKTYDIPDIEVPDCMYRIKPINSNELASDGQSMQRNAHSVQNGNAGNADCIRKQKTSPSVNTTGAKKRLVEKHPESRSPVDVKAKMDTNVVTRMDTSEDSTNPEQSRNAMILELEARQQEIIKKLLNLRDKLNTMNSQFCQNVSTPCTVGKSTVKKSVDVVVNADPDKPPYSVLMLVKLLKENYGAGIILRTHTHSSYHEPLPTQVNLFNQDPSASVTGEMITITIIWKKVMDQEVSLIVEPSRQAPIRGEGNIARYLSRLLPSVHHINYDTLSWDDIVKIDGILMKVGDHLTDLKILETQLGRSTPFLFGEASIADCVMFSTVVPYMMSHKTVQSGQFPRVFKWINACQELGGFHLSL